MTNEKTQRDNNDIVNQEKEDANKRETQRKLDELQTKKAEQLKADQDNRVLINSALNEIYNQKAADATNEEMQRQLDQLKQGSQIKSAEQLKADQDNWVPINDALNEAGHGFGCGNHVNQAHEFIDMVAKKYPNYLANSLFHTVGGFAQGSHKKQMYEFLDMVKEKYPDNVNETLCGMAAYSAFDGNTKQAYDILDKAEKEYPEHVPDIMCSMAGGFAQRGDTAQVYKLLAAIEAKYPQSAPALLGKTAFHLGVSGDMNGCKQFIEEIKKEHPERLEETLGRMAKGVAEGGKDTNEFLNFVKGNYSDHVPVVLKKMSDGFSNVGQKDKANIYSGALEEYTTHLNEIPLGISTNSRDPSSNITAMSIDSLNRPNVDFVSEPHPSNQQHALNS